MILQRREKTAIAAGVPTGVLKNNIPNIITVSRMAFAAVLMYWIYEILSSEAGGYGGLAGGYGGVPDACPVLCFAAIISSDVIDGHIARKTNCVTATGAKLDIAADIFYVMGAACIFVYFHMLPVWFPVVLAVSFTVFLTTSKLLSLRRGHRFSAVFDAAGKTAANLTLMLPGVFVFRSIIISYEFVMLAGAFAITGLFGVAFIYRVVVCNRLV